MSNGLNLSHQIIDTGLARIVALIILILVHGEGHAFQCCVGTGAKFADTF